MAARPIVDQAAAQFNGMLFSNGGADGIRNMIRMARLHTGRNRILWAYRSHHGNPGATLVAIGDWSRIPNEYARGHRHFLGPALAASSSGRPDSNRTPDARFATSSTWSRARLPPRSRPCYSSRYRALLAFLFPARGSGGGGGPCDKCRVVLIPDEVIAGFDRQQ